MRRLLLFLFGIVAGGAAGAGVSVLFSPASGDEMRASVRERYQEVLDESARAAAARRAKLEAELDEMTGNTSPDTPTA